MQAIFKSKTFWITFVLVVVVFFALGLISSKTYKSEMRLLLIPRSEVAARNIGQILRNAEEIPKSLSFYNKMLELNTDIEDNFSNLPDSQRKNSWNDKIEVTRIEKSGILKMDVFSDNQLQAEIISRQMTQSEIAVLGKYYALSDLNVKTIDGPVVSTISKKNFWALALLSLVLGLIVGAVISLLAGLFSRQENFFKFESLEKYFQPSDEKDKKIVPDYFSTPENEMENLEDVYTFEKKGAAPDNLPIAKDEILSKKKETKEPSLGSTENVNQIVAREATPEEVKARLNKLLNS